MIRIWGLIFGLVVSFLGHQAEAQSSTARLPLTVETTPLPSIAAPKLGAFTLNASIKSRNTSGRLYEYQGQNGRQYSLKNEYSVGATHQSGWGLSAMAVTSGKTYDDSTRNAFGAGDPSVTLGHPLYADDTNRLWGQLRTYFPVTDRSKSNEILQVAYYLFASRKLSGRQELFNALIFREFYQPSYKSSDTTFLIEEALSYAKTLNSWFSLGVVQRVSLEWHDQSPVGTAADFYPFAKFALNKNASLEPRVILPVYKVNEVYDSARNAALDNAQAELYLSLSI